MDAVRRPSLGPRARAGLLGLACLAVSVQLYSSYRTEAQLRDANRLAVAGRYGQAGQVAATIRARPTAVRAAAVVAYAEAAAGNLAGADAAFARAVGLNPQNWTLRADWASILLARGRRATALAEMRTARQLNPRLVLAPGFCAARGRAARGRIVVICRG